MTQMMNLIFVEKLIFFFFHFVFAVRMLQAPYRMRLCIRKRDGLDHWEWDGGKQL